MSPAPLGQRPGADKTERERRNRLGCRLVAILELVPEDILTGELEEAAKRLEEGLPDVAAAFDIVVPRAFAGEVGAGRRFTFYYVLMTERIAEDVERQRPEVAAGLVEGLLRSEITAMPFIAPAPSARGVWSRWSARLAGSRASGTSPYRRRRSTPPRGPATGAQLKQRSWSRRDRHRWSVL